MATLNLGNYSGLKGGSVIGYSAGVNDGDYVVEKELTADEKAKNYKVVATVSGSGKDFSLDVRTVTGATEFIDTGDRNWTITVGGGQKVELGSGKDFVNATMTSDDQTINTGDGKDTVVVDAATTAGQVNLGDGADSLVAQGGTFSVAGGAGKDSINVSALKSATGTVTLTDFDATEDVLVTGTTFTATATSILGSDGTINLGTGTVKVNETNGYYVVNTDNNGVVAWAADAGSNIDLSSYTKSVTIVGNDNESTSDTLIGGSKSDTIVAGSGDYAYGGAGNDKIVLTGSEAAYVGLATAGGKDTVLSGTFKAGTDVVYLFENSISDGVTLSKKNTNITVKQGKGELTLANVVGTKTDETVINIQDNSGTTYDVDFVSGTASISGVDSIHSVYYSDSSNEKNNKLDFSSVDDSLVVDLGNTGIFANTGNATYYGNFASVVGGTGDTILMGSASNKETLAAGNGNTTLWGGGKAADVLQGNKTTDTSVTYFYTTGDGKDTVTNASWGSSDQNDVLYFKDVTLASIKNDSGTATFTMADSADKLTVKDVSANTVVKFTNDGENIQQAKIGYTGKSNTWTYEEGVNMYLGGKSNTLTVSEDADIWLDGSKGTSYENVSKVSASSSSGTVVIAGNGSNDEVLEAGKGESSLWGGAGSSNDTLKGAAGGTTTYYFGKGEGNDVITSTTSDDKVLLYNVASSDIASIDTSTSGQMKFTLTDGATLTIKGMNSSSSVSEFELSDGSKWTYSYSNKSWTQH